MAANITKKSRTTKHKGQLSSTFVYFEAPFYDFETLKDAKRGRKTPPAKLTSHLVPPYLRTYENKLRASHEMWLARFLLPVILVPVVIAAAGAGFTIASATIIHLGVTA